MRSYFKVVGLFVATCFFTPLHAQLDSSDLDVSFQEPVEMDVMDSIYLVGTDMQEIVLSFELTDTSFELGKIWVELILVPEGFNAVLLSQQVYTPEELELQGLIEDEEVTISFGCYTTSAPYEITVRLEDIYGSNVRLITKTL